MTRPARDRRIAVAKFLCQHRFARAALFGEEHAEISVHLFAARENQRFTKPDGLLSIGLVAGVEDCSDFGIEVSEDKVVVRFWPTR